MDVMDVVVRTELARSVTGLARQHDDFADVLVLVLVPKGQAAGGLTLACHTHPSGVDGAPFGRSCARCQRERSRCRPDRRSPHRRRSMDEEADRLER
jgi:hypothetical protein